MVCSVVQLNLERVGEDIPEAVQSSPSLLGVKEMQRHYQVTDNIHHYSCPLKTPEPAWMTMSVSSQVSVCIM